MFRKFNPKTIAPPAATYVHGLEVPPKRDLRGLGK
jgi:hypothetical protein